MRNFPIKIGSLKQIKAPYSESHTVLAKDLPCFLVEDDTIMCRPYDYNYFLVQDKGSMLIIDNVYSYNEYVVYVCVRNNFQKIAFFFLDEKSVCKFFKTQEEYSIIVAKEKELEKTATAC